MKLNPKCSHCGKIFENQRLLNNHYNQIGVDKIKAAGFFEKYRKMMIKQKEEYDKRKEEDSDLISNEKDNKKKSL